MTSVCDRPPTGWTCSRPQGHEGPCAASPAGDYITVPPEHAHRVEAAKDAIARSRDRELSHYEHAMIELAVVIALSNPDREAALEATPCQEPSMTDTKRAALARRVEVMQEVRQLTARFLQAERRINEYVEDDCWGLVTEQAAIVEECARALGELGRQQKEARATVNRSPIFDSDTFRDWGPC